MNHRLVRLTLLVALAPFCPIGVQGGEEKDKDKGPSERVVKTDAEWAKQLSRAQFEVTRLKATEPPFTGKYVNNHARGTYVCVCCDAFTTRGLVYTGDGEAVCARAQTAGANTAAVKLRNRNERLFIFKLQGRR